MATVEITKLSDSQVHGKYFLLKTLEPELGLAVEVRLKENGAHVFREADFSTRTGERQGRRKHLI